MIKSDCKQNGSDTQLQAIIAATVYILILIRALLAKFTIDMGN
jgi:hypothetical protein